MASNSGTNQSDDKQFKDQSIGRQAIQGPINRMTSNARTNQSDGNQLRANQSDDKQLKDQSIG